MKKDIIILYLIALACLLFGWFAARDLSHEVSRGDCLTIAYISGISAVALTIGHILNRIYLVAYLLRIGAVIYVGIYVALTLFQSDWSEGFVFPVIWALVAFVVYGIHAVMICGITSRIISTHSEQSGAGNR